MKSPWQILSKIYACDDPKKIDAASHRKHNAIAIYPHSKIIDAIEDIFANHVPGKPAITHRKGDCFAARNFDGRVLVGCVSDESMSLFDGTKLTNREMPEALLNLLIDEIALDDPASIAISIFERFSSHAHSARVINQEGALGRLLCDSTSIGLPQTHRIKYLQPYLTWCGKIERDTMIAIAHQNGDCYAILRPNRMWENNDFTPDLKRSLRAFAAAQEKITAILQPNPQNRITHTRRR